MICLHLSSGGQEAGVFDSSWCGWVGGFMEGRQGRRLTSGQKIARRWPSHIVSWSLSFGILQMGMMALSFGQNDTIHQCNLKLHKCEGLLPGNSGGVGRFGLCPNVLD